MSLPINVQLGAATLRGGEQQLQLSNLNGTLLVEVDKDVRIASDMNLSIEDSNLLGKNRADVKAVGLDLQANKGKAVASIKSCSVEVSDDAIEEAIRDEVPKTKTWKMNKSFLSSSGGIATLSLRLQPSPICVLTRLSTTART